jgi:hypothetical protein
MTAPDPQVKSRATIGSILAVLPLLYRIPIYMKITFLEYVRSYAPWLNITTEWAHLINAICEPILYCT